MLDELLLRLLFGFISVDPVAVMQMLAPQFLVVVVMLDDLVLCVGQRHQSNIPPSWTVLAKLPGSRIVVGSRFTANRCAGASSLLAATMSQSASCQRFLS
jgi:hypothetical protein